MTRLTQLALLLISAVACTSAIAQQSPSSMLEQRMGSAKFREAGLDRQTPEQLKVLEEWLLHNATDIVASQPASEASTATAAATGTTARRSWFGRTKSGKNDKEEVSNSTVNSRYAGTFTGWRPGNILELENGQKWKVNDSSSLHVRKPLDNPMITVAPGILGAWNMKVEGYNTSARVIPAN